VKVIFLDIDGVLNHSATRSDVLPTAKEPLPIPIAPECVARLNRLIAETGAKIVILSSCRARGSISQAPTSRQRSR
jgi:HAD domain in Swiss Army Knife RNA repair proteins